MVERRDQVLMTFFVPASFCASTFFMRWSSTNGPFFKLRGICQPSMGPTRIAVGSRRLRRVRVTPRRLVTDASCRDGG
jgi:hypothetical protein